MSIKLLTALSLCSLLSSCGNGTPIRPILSELPNTSQAVPIEVIPPPEPAAATIPNYNFMVMRPTTITNRFGNPLYELQMFADGKLIASVLTVSGRAHTQSRNRNQSGTEAPLPNGKYTVSRQWVAGSSAEVGGRFLPINPQFNTGRFALGIHYDPSFERNPKEDGTEGCIATTNKQDLDVVLAFVRIHKPHYLNVSI
jgi:hypothetical protein